MVCSYLTPTDVARLAGVSRDHYLAVQQPLYERIDITAYASLIKLVDTLRRVPVVSHISPQQRLRWFKLSDEQLRERDIKYLDLVLDRRKDGSKITGAIVANCIGAISRKCYSTKILLTLNEMPSDFVKQLERFGLPNVCKLTLFLGSSMPAGYGQQSAAWKIWDFAFAGTTFPDLRDVYINTVAESEAGIAGSLEESVTEADDHAYDYDSHPITEPITAGPFYGLRKLESIRLTHNTYLDVPILQSLFGSEIIPARLTKLEIVDCPNLHPVKHLAALSTLLERALQLVQHLKLHLCKLDHFDDGETFLDTRYAAKINDHPEHHFCNIIRELGQKIQSLDLAVPFACDRMFPPAARMPRAATTLPNFPSIPLHPIGTLSDRVLSEKYRMRRLICWHGICRRAHLWEDMVGGEKGASGEVSWLMLYPPKDLGSWHFSGYSPVTFDANEALMAPDSV